MEKELNKLRTKITKNLIEPGFFTSIQMELVDDFHAKFLYEKDTLALKISSYDIENKLSCISGVSALSDR